MPDSVSPSQTNPPAINTTLERPARYDAFDGCGHILSAQKILGGRPDNDFIDLHIRRLLDCVSDRVRN